MLGSFPGLVGPVSPLTQTRTPRDNTGRVKEAEASKNASTIKGKAWVVEPQSTEILHMYDIFRLTGNGLVAREVVRGHLRSTHVAAIVRTCRVSSNLASRISSAPSRMAMSSCCAARTKRVRLRNGSAACFPWSTSRRARSSAVPGSTSTLVLSRRKEASGSMNLSSYVGTVRGQRVEYTRFSSPCA